MSSISYFREKFIGINSIGVIYRDIFRGIMPV